MPKANEFHYGTDLARTIKEMHDKFVGHLLNRSVRTLKRTAVDLHRYYHGNEHYTDIQFLPEIIAMITKVISEAEGKPWDIHAYMNNLAFGKRKPLRQKRVGEAHTGTFSQIPWRRDYTQLDLSKLDLSVPKPKTKNETE